MININKNQRLLNFIKFNNLFFISIKFFYRDYIYFIILSNIILFFKRYKYEFYI